MELRKIRGTTEIQGFFFYRAENCLLTGILRELIGKISFRPGKDLYLFR
jgi:hypothetical protein